MSADHAEKYAEPDETHYELKFTRSHLKQSTVGASDPTGETYTVFTAVYIDVNRMSDFRLALAEVPPPEEGEPITESATVLEATPMLGAGIQAAKMTAFKLPLFNPPRSRSVRVGMVGAC